MARTALNAPAHVILQRKALGNANNSPDAAPTLQFGGAGIQDDRLPYNLVNSANAPAVIGWYGDSPLVVNAVPSTKSLVSIAAAQVPVSGTPMTLVSASALGITVLATTFLAFPSLNTIPVAALAIDNNPAYVKFGTRDHTWFFDHTKGLARNIQMQSAGNDSAGFFTVAGYDIYGYPMTEKITGANAGTAQGKKAFKWVTSITPSGTMSGSNANAGQGDVYGFGIRADQFGYVYIIYNGTTITASTGFVAADTTSPATNVTGDVRGTYAVQSASDGVKRLEIAVFPNIAGMGTTPLTISTGLWGVTQV